MQTFCTAIPLHRAIGTKVQLLGILGPRLSNDQCGNWPFYASSSPFQVFNFVLFKTTFQIHLILNYPQAMISQK
jgi:hypothetical protein